MCSGYNTNRKFYGIHHLIFVIFMFPWFKEIINKQIVNGEEIKDLNKSIKNLYFNDQKEQNFTSLKKIFDNKNDYASSELQLMKIKRFSIDSSNSNNKILNKNSVNELFKINKNTLIRTEDSRSNGAKYINETDLKSNEECLKWCLQNEKCNLAVYEEKNPGSCYLFDCGTDDNFKCKFTNHNSYTNQHETTITNLKKDNKNLINLTSLNNQSLSSKNLSIKESLDKLKTDTKISTIKCQHYQFACKNSSECIAIYNVCDGIPQCPDGSDEALDLHCPDTNSQYYTNITKNSNDLENKKINQQNFMASDFNYKKLPEIIKLDKNNFVSSDQKNTNNNLMKPWFLMNSQNLMQPIYNPNWNDYNAYFGQLNNINNMKSNPQNKDINSLLWQMLDSNQQQKQQKNFLETLTNNLQQQQYFQNLLNKQQLASLLENPNKNLPINYFQNINNKKNKDDDSSIASNKTNEIKKNDEIDKLKNLPIQPIETKSIKNDKILSKIELSTVATLKVNNIKKEQYVSYDFKQPYIQFNGKLQEDFYTDDNEQETNSAVIALILGLFITIFLVIIVGFRMRSIKKRIHRRGGRNLAHDADYLINGMYL